MSALPPGLALWLAALVITAGVYDIRFRRVPNRLVLLGLIIGFSFNTLFAGADGALYSLKGAGLAFLVYFVLYALRGMGAGDVKLMAAVGATVGPMNWLGIFVLTGLLGGVVAVVMLLAKGRLRRTLANAGYIVKSLSMRMKPYEGRPDLDVNTNQGMRLPHAAVIMVGTVTFLAVTWISQPA